MDATLRQSYRHCGRFALRASSSFYWSFWLLPRAKRRAMYALYSFARRTDDLSDSDQPADARRRQLAQWRAALARSLDGACDDPLLPAVADTVQRFNIPRAYLFDVIDGVEMDLDIRRYETFDELKSYCYRVASAVGLACLHVWGFTSDAAIEPATQCGLAFQLTNILRDIREDAQRQRIYLPLDDLRRFDYEEDDLLNGLANDQFEQVVQYEIARAEQLYRGAARLEQYLHPDGRRAFNLMSLTYLRLLAEIKQRRRQLLGGRVRLSYRQKAAVVWSAIRGRRFCDEAMKFDSIDSQSSETPLPVAKGGE